MRQWGHGTCALGSPTSTDTIRQRPGAAAIVNYTRRGWACPATAGTATAGTATASRHCHCHRQITARWQLLHVMHHLSPRQCIPCKLYWCMGGSRRFNSAGANVPAADVDRIGRHCSGQPGAVPVRPQDARVLQPRLSRPGLASRRRGCHFADTSSPSLLKHLLKGDLGVQQNDSLASAAIGLAHQPAARFFEPRRGGVAGRAVRPPSRRLGQCQPLPMNADAHSTLTAVANTVCQVCVITCV